MNSEEHIESRQAWETFVTARNAFDDANRAYYLARIKRQDNLDKLREILKDAGDAFYDIRAKTAAHRHRRCK